jgi:hypothetical protein
MKSNFDSLWCAIQHPLGPSRELGSYANHQESVEQLIREMNARVLPIKRGLGTLAYRTPDPPHPLVIFSRDDRGPQNLSMSSARREVMYWA